MSSRPKRKAARREAERYCAHPDHDIFPMYGVGPHVCFHERGPGFTIGQSLSKPRVEFPPNFWPDDTEGPQDDGAPVVGIWSCPGCLGKKLSLAEVDHYERSEFEMVAPLVESKPIHRCEPPTAADPSILVIRGRVRHTQVVQDAEVYIGGVRLEGVGTVELTTELP